MREEFEKMAAAGKLEPRHIELLAKLVESRFCMHRSWGFGQIRAVDTVFARFTIDFPNKPGHAKDRSIAWPGLFGKSIVKRANTVSTDHILARKASDLESL